MAEEGWKPQPVHRDCRACGQRLRELDWDYLVDNNADNNPDVSFARLDYDSDLFCFYCIMRLDEDGNDCRALPFNNSLEENTHYHKANLLRLERLVNALKNDKEELAKACIGPVGKYADIPHGWREVQMDNSSNVIVEHIFNHEHEAKVKFYFVDDEFHFSVLNRDESTRLGLALQGKGVFNEFGEELDRILKANQNDDDLWERIVGRHIKADKKGR